MERIEELRKKYEKFKARNLKLDMSRGKPSDPFLYFQISHSDLHSHKGNCIFEKKSPVI